MYYELKKVTWPTKQRLISYSIIVLVFMLFMSVVIGLLDMGASAGVRSLIPNDHRRDTVPGRLTETAREAADTAEEAAETAAEAAEAARRCGRTATVKTADGGCRDRDGSR